MYQICFTAYLYGLRFIYRHISPRLYSDFKQRIQDADLHVPIPRPWGYLAIYTHHQADSHQPPFKEYWVWGIHQQLPTEPLGHGHAHTAMLHSTLQNLLRTMLQPFYSGIYDISDGSQLQHDQAMVSSGLWGSVLDPPRANNPSDPGGCFTMVLHSNCSIHTIMEGCFWRSRLTLPHVQSWPFDLSSACHPRREGYMLQALVGYVSSKL